MCGAKDEVCDPLTDWVNRYSEDEDEMSTVASFVRCMDNDAMSITSLMLFVFFFPSKSLLMDL